MLHTPQGRDVKGITARHVGTTVVHTITMAMSVTNRVWRIDECEKISMEILHKVGLKDETYLNKVVQRDTIEAVWQLLTEAVAKILQEE